MYIAILRMSTLLFVLMCADAYAREVSGERRGVMEGS